MGLIAVDIINLYKQYFGDSYAVGEVLVDWGSSHGVEWNRKYNGVEVMMPITLKDAEGEVFLPCATISCSRKNTIIRTAVSERAGTIHEQFAVGDWIIQIKGVVIGTRGDFPEETLCRLLKMADNHDTVEIACPLTDLLLQGCSKIIVESIDIPAIEGRNIRHLPFTLACESDFVDSLIIEKN